MAGGGHASLLADDRLVPAVHGGVSGHERRHDPGLGNREVIRRPRIRLLALVDRDLPAPQLGHHQGKVKLKLRAIWLLICCKKKRVIKLDRITKRVSLVFRIIRMRLYSKQKMGVRSYNVSLIFSC